MWFRDWSFLNTFDYDLFFWSCLTLAKFLLHKKIDLIYSDMIWTALFQTFRIQVPSWLLLVNIIMCKHLRPLYFLKYVRRWEVVNFLTCTCALRSSACVFVRCPSSLYFKTERCTRLIYKGSPKRNLINFYCTKSRPI